MKKLKVGIIGATGMVGQRFIMLLNEHPYFEITALVAGPRSAGQKTVLSCQDLGIASALESVLPKGYTFFLKWPTAND